MTRPLADPPRLRDGTSGAPPQLSGLFAAAERDVASEAQLARMAQSLGPLLDAAFVPPRGTLARPWLKPLKLALVAGALVGGGLAGERALRRDAAPPSATVAAPVASPVKPAAQATPPVTPPASVLAPDSAASETANPPASASGTRRYKAASPTEAQLLEHARQALGANPARALSLVKRHQALFPGGVLKQEREVIAIEALRRLGASEDANKRAADFATRYPGSAHRRAVETGLTK